MPLPLPLGKQIHITYKKLTDDTGMSSMELAPDHYALSFMLHGDRRVITPLMSFTLHEGYVNAMPPLLYHKTLRASQEYYENILIKFSPDFVTPLIERVGQKILDDIYAYPPKRFEDDIRKELFAQARQMYEIYTSQEYDLPYLEFKLQNILFQMLLTIHEHALTEDLGQVHHAPLSRPVVDVIYYIENHYDRDLKLEDVAAMAGYSPSYFSRVFQSQLGTPFSEYLTGIRLKHVCDDLLTTDKSVTDIALEHGFSYPGNMTESFRKHYGMTPLQFRRSGRP